MEEIKLINQLQTAITVMGEEITNLKKQINSLEMTITRDRKDQWQIIKELTEKIEKQEATKCKKK